MPQSFADRLAEGVRTKGSALVLGLDPRPERMPRAYQGRGIEGVTAFHARLIELCASRVVAIKPQIAFFERLGVEGLAAWAATCKLAHDADLLVVGDVKRGDIGSTAEAYAEAHYGWSDALTLHPYLGDDSLEPFLARCRDDGRGAFVLCATSNAGWARFQDLRDAADRPLWRAVAAAIREWNGSCMAEDARYGPVGAVVGATHPALLVEAREAMPASWLLLPGVGAQGASARELGPAFDDEGLGAIVPVSRGLAQCFGPGDEDWKDKVTGAADELVGPCATRSPPSGVWPAAHERRGEAAARIAARVPMGALGMTDAWLALLGGDPRLAHALPPRPTDVESLLELAAPRIGLESCEQWRPVVAAAARALAEEHDAPRPVLDAARKLAEPGTLAIVTGQQPGLFGGPMYLWHKLATAVNLARRVAAAGDTPEVVVVFWNHGEDHDWGEANHGFLVNAGLDLQRIRLSLPATGRVLSRVPVGAALEDALEEAFDLLPATDARDAELRAMRPRGDDETLSTHLTRLVFRHLGEAGVLVVDPMRLPVETREPLLPLCARASRLRGLFKRTVEELEERGFESTVDPEAPLFFQVAPDGLRQPLPDGELPAPGHLLSPGVLLRPIWQDMLVPTVAGVVGPGEVSYGTLIGELSVECGVPRAPLVPRTSMTHAGDKLCGFLERWHLALADLRAGAQAVEDRIVTLEGPEAGAPDDDERVEAALRHLAGEFAASLRALEDRIAEVDRSLVQPAARLGGRTDADLRKLAEKVGRSRRNRAGTWRQHARRLCAELAPRGRLQERVLPALPFVARHGLGFLPGLCDPADPFATQHLLCRIPG
ncbi:MAG: orotidine-5'-phosphate decarboxylase [Planctomycetota bacterium]